MPAEDPTAVVRAFGRHLRPHRRTLITAGLLTVGRSAFELAQPWPLAITVDYLVDRDRLTGALAPLRSLPPVAVAALAAAASVITVGAAGLTGYVGEYQTGAAAERIGSDLRVAVFGRLQRLALTFHDRNRTGDLVERLIADVERVQDALVAWFETLLPQVLALAGMVVVLFAVNLELGMAALAVLPALVYLTVTSQRRMSAAERRARSLSGTLAAQATEILRNVRVVQAFSRDRDEEQRFRVAADQTAFSAVEAIELEARFYPLTELVLSAGTGLVLFLGILQVAAGELPVGTLLVVLTYVYNLYAPVEELSEVASVLARGSAGAGRLAEILDSQEMVAEAPGALDAPPGAPALVLRGVRFSYREGTPAALDDLWLEVGPGETVAVVGPSGAGKSTLLALLLRLYDPDEGSIELSGLDLRRLTLRSLRERIALVPQDPSMLDGTIEENIAFGRPDVTAEDLQRAAERSLVDEFVERLPEGYATGVGEGGRRLSGGQCRRIALARAIMREQSSLLLLDEPTSGLDAESEAIVLAALKRVVEGRTTVIVSHTPAVAALADRVVILENGRILEDGAAHDLLARVGAGTGSNSLERPLRPAPPIPPTTRAGFWRGGEEDAQ